MINHLVGFHGVNHNVTLVISGTSHISGVEQISGATIVQPTLPIALANSLSSYIFNSDIPKQLLLRWIIVHSIAFHRVTAPEFRALLMYLCAVVDVTSLSLLIVLKLIKIK